MQVMLVEDNEMLAAAVVKALRTAGFSVNHISRGDQALAALKTSKPDILVLDLGLPGMDGLEVLRGARRQQFTFEMDELLARLRALERRLGSVKSKNIVIDEVDLDTHSYEVSVAGEPLGLSRREYMLLKALMESAGKVQTRDILDSKLYGWGEEVSSNTVEVHIHNLRKKLPAGFIQTVRGLGYVVKKGGGAA